MRGSLLRSRSVVAALVVLTGCASPQPVLDLAGQGAATVGLAEKSLREYVGLTKAQLAARMDLLRQDAQQDARDRAQAEFDAFLDRRADLPANGSGAALIRDLGDERRRIRDKDALELEKIASSIRLDLAPVAQVPAEKLGAAKKSFAILSQELSAKEWVDLAAGYAREIAAGVATLQASKKDGKSGKD